MSEQEVREGACGAPIGAQVDISTALRFDRDQQRKAKEEADKKSAQDKLEQAQAIVKELGDQVTREERVETLYFVKDKPNGDQCALAARARAKIRSAVDYVYGSDDEACERVMGLVPEGSYTNTLRHELDGEAGELTEQAERAAAIKAQEAGEAEQGNVPEVPQPKVSLSTTINAALDGLDHANDAHWTSDGLPAMKVIEDLTGDKSIKRSDVEAAQPGFVRVKPEGISLG